MLELAGRARAIIEAVTPLLDGGRFPIKRVCGEEVTVEADAFCDGHDALGCVLCYAPPDTTAWHEVPMEFLSNDRWRGIFTVSHLGVYRYTVVAWVDHFTSWWRSLAKKVEAGQDVATDPLIGGALVRCASM